MDEINDFFDFSKDFQRITVPRGVITGNAAVVGGPSYDSKPAKREHIGNDYARSLVEKELKTLMDVDMDDDLKKSANVSCMDTLDNLSDDEEVIQSKINKIDDAIYDKYRFDLNRDKTMPIHDTREEIISSIRSRPIVILEGDTGCGKTTQVPQYILDDAFRRREYCKIVVTQPRRIAAISIARRVSNERKWEEGTVVGFQVGLHSKMSMDTRILYCTTGVLLQKLIKDKNMNQFTHIVLDEVHERDQDMDFLLIVIRRLLATNSKKCKIILMSATINTTEFADYFKIRRNPAPVIKVDTRRLYQVRDYYLDDLQRIVGSRVAVDFSEPGINKEAYILGSKLIVVIDNIEKQEQALNSSDSGSGANSNSVLVFLPGINEIDTMCKKLMNVANGEDGRTIKLWPIRLHSMVAPDEQVQVFQRAPAGYRKVILATNIAESSITVPDVKYVIDYCLTKCLVTDTSTNFSSLQLQWASRANCRQRAGRAGRVMNGRVYRLVPRHFYENFLDEYGMPEMLRCPLENAVLKSKLLQMGPPPDILGLALNPPNLSDIHNTILMLKEVGALYRYTNGVYTPEDGDLSFIGRVMSALPLDIRLSRLIVLGHLFGALEEAIIMAAGLSVRSIFTMHFNSKMTEMDAYTQKLYWADGSGSDLFAILKAYKVWLSLCQQHNIMEGDGEYSWGKRYFINLRSIKEMNLLVNEVTQRLIPLGIKVRSAHQQMPLLDREKTIILKLIIAGAFYPNYFTRSNQNDIERERSIYHILGGNDPTTTVYFTGFGPRHIGQLYIGAVKDLFKEARIRHNNIEVRFQSGSERLFVTFKPDNEEEESDGRLIVPGRIRPEVYKAVRMRTVGINTVINVMDPRQSIMFAEHHGLGKQVEGVWEPFKESKRNAELVALPPVFSKYMRGYITHIVSCSKFYFQPLSEQMRLREINEVINKSSTLRNKFEGPRNVDRGMVLAAPYNGKYHRAKILKVMSSARNHVQFKVLFIDYGNTGIVDFVDLRDLRSESNILLLELPPRVFECRLAMIAPSSVKNPNGAWVDEAMELLQDVADKGIVGIDVYSVVGNVANIIVHMENGTFNDLLVFKSLARKSDESYLSKADHDFRERKQSISNRFEGEQYARQNEEYMRTIQIEDELKSVSPPRELCVKGLQLRGPYSPLETRVYSAMRVGTWKSVHIERESVNSVMLDTEPTEMHERLLVAASVTESQNSDILTARATTLMPNINGFAAMVTMLFSPTVQVKRNKSKTKFTAVLAGLGYDEKTYKSLYEEHDIVLNLDCEFSPEDLSLINQIRYSMETMIYTDDCMEVPSVLPSVHTELTSSIKKCLIKLLNRSRNYVDLTIDSNDCRWERLDEMDIIENPSLYDRTRCIFMMHKAQRLYEEEFNRTHVLITRCRELHRLRHFDGTIQPTICSLCKMTLESITQLRIHLLSQLHRDREQQIGYKE